jgi:hypothetical protein
MISNRRLKTQNGGKKTRNRRRMTWKKTPLNTRNRRWVIEIADLRHETGDG